MNTTTFAPEDVDASGIARADAVSQEDQIAQQGAVAVKDALPPPEQSFASSALESVVTGGVGALDGLSAGLGNAGIASIADQIDPSGGDGAEFRRQLALAREKHGTSYGVGQFAGMVAPALASGGLSTLSTPAGAISGIGGAVERGVGGGLVGAIARGTVEGGIYGATTTAGDGLLNHDLTAEKLLAGAGLGAVLGGAAGGVLHGAGQAFSGLRGLATRGGAEAATEGGERVAQALGGEATEPGARDLASRAYEKGLDLTSKASGVDRDELGQVFQRNAEGARLRALSSPEAREKLLDSSAKEFSGHLNDVLRNTSAVTEEARGALKASQIGRLVATGNEEEVALAAHQHLDGIINGIDEIVNSDAGAAPQHAKALKGLATVAYEARAKIASGADNAVTAVELDNVKRAAQAYANAARNGVHEIADPYEKILAYKSTDLFTHEAEKLRNLLENDHLFGDFGKAQKRINAVWSKNIDAERRINRTLLTEGGRDPNDPYRTLKIADVQKSYNHLGSLTNARKDVTHQAVKDFLTSSREVADAIAEHYEIPSEKLASVRQVSDSANAAHKLLEKTEADLNVANRFHEWRKLEGKDSHLATIGALIGHAPGALLGGAIGAAKNPTRLAQQISALERVSGKTDNFVSRFVKDFFAGSEGKPTKLISSQAGHDVTSNGKRFSEAVDQTSKLPALIERLPEKLGDLPPAFAVALANKTSVAAQFLASKVPNALREPDPYMPQRDWSGVPPYERTKFLRYYDAVNDPGGALKNGSNMSYEAAEAIRATQPLLYQQLQKQVQDMAAEKAAKGDLDTDAVRRMGVLFGVQTLPTQRPDVFQMLQQNVAAPPAQGQNSPDTPSKAPLRPVKLPDQTSPLDRLEQGNG